MTSGQRWYVVQSQPNAERKAVMHLERQGFTTYLPRYLKRRRHARRVEIVGAPLFPRYLFVGIDLTMQRWRSKRKPNSATSTRIGKGTTTVCLSIGTIPPPKPQPLR